MYDKRWRIFETQMNLFFGTLLGAAILFFLWAMARAVGWQPVVFGVGGLAALLGVVRVVAIILVNREDR